MSAPSAEVLGPATGRPGDPRHGDHSRSAWRSRLTRFDIKYTPYFLISPFYLLFITFGLFPLAYNFYESLRHHDLMDPAADGWSGFENYKKLMDDPDFWHALTNTFGLYVLSSGPQILVALMLAAVLNRRLRMQTLFRMGVLLPFITPITASTFVFGAVFAKYTGLANAFLDMLGVGTVDWKADTWSSWIAIITMVDWRWTGYWAIIFLAAMQSVSKDLYEAATIDGAGPWRQFWRLTVPLIRPTLIFAVVISAIGGMQLFTEPLLFDSNPQAANGGTDGQFQTINMYIYKIAWRYMNLGYAAALSWALFLIIVVVAGLNALVTNRIGGRK